MTEFGPCYILSTVAPEAWQPQITGPSRRLILDDVNMNYGSQIAQHVLTPVFRKRLQRCKTPFYSGTD